MAASLRSTRSVAKAVLPTAWTRMDYRLSTCILTANAREGIHFGGYTSETSLIVFSPRHDQRQKSGGGVDALLRRDVPTGTLVVDVGHETDCCRDQQDSPAPERFKIVVPRMDAT